MESPSATTSTTSCAASFTSTLLPGTTTSSTSGPTRKKADGSRSRSISSLALPVGFCITPLSPVSSYSTSSNAHDSTTRSASAINRLSEDHMHMCTTCLSYLNPYCSRVVTEDPYSMGMGSNNGQLCKWKCSICHAINVAPCHILESSEVYHSPIVEYRQTIMTPSSSLPSSSTRTRTQYNMMVLDANLPATEVQAILKSLRNIIQMNDNDHDHDNDYEECWGLLIYGKLIHLYQIALRGIASADIYSPLMEPEDCGCGCGVDDVERGYFGDWDQIEYCTSVFFGLNQKSNVQVQAAVDGSGPGSGSGSVPSASHSHSHSHSTSQSNSKPMSRREMLLRKRQERMQKKNQEEKKFDGFDPSQAAERILACRKQQNNKRNKNNRDRSRGRDDNLRCTGEAVAYASHLIQTMNMNGEKDRDNVNVNVNGSGTGRIMVFTNGNCNYGKGSTGNGNGYKDNESIDANADALPYLYSVAQQSMDNGVGIDILTTGMGAGVSFSFGSGMQGLMTLVKPSSGYVLHHMSSWAEDSLALERNVRFVLKETSMSRMTMKMGGAGSSSRSRSKRVNNEINGCILDIRMPSFITPQLMHGNNNNNINNPSATNFGVNPNERNIFSECASLCASQGIATHTLPSVDVMASTCLRVSMGRYDPHATISVMIDVDNTDTDADTDEEAYAHFQFITRYMDPHNHGEIITRVCTQRLAIASERTNHEFTLGDHDADVENAYLQSVNGDIIAVLLAKEAAYRSMTFPDQRDEVGDEYNYDNNANIVGMNVTIKQEEVEECALEARIDLDATIHAMSKAYTSLHQKPDTKGKDKNKIVDEALSPELYSAMRQLHHFRRGLIIGAGLPSPDDRLLQRDMFLRSPWNTCSQMIAPSLWQCTMDNGNGNQGRIVFHTIPAGTLALEDHSILAADCFDTLIIWSGKETWHESYDVLRRSCAEFLLHRSRDRIPAPSLQMLNEGESMCRKLLHRLAPSHGDPDVRQGTEFGYLGAERLTNVKSKFRFYDGSVDPSFWGWFSSVIAKGSSGKVLTST